MNNEGINFPQAPQDWTKAIRNKIYYSSAIKSYVSVVESDQEIIPQEQLATKSGKYYAPFVENVLKQLNLDDKKIDSLIGKVKLISHFIDPAPLVKEKLYLAIASIELEGLDKREEPELENSAMNIYSSATFFDKIEKIAERFKDYQQQYISDIYKNTGKTYAKLDFLKESDNLYKFRTNFIDLLDANTVSISNFKHIEISFVQQNRVGKVALINENIRKEIKILLEDFSTEYPQNRSQTMSFIYNLPELSEAVKSNNNDYKSIVEDYFLPEISQSQQKRRSDNIIERSNSKKFSIATKNSDVSKDFASLKQISQKSVELLKKEILTSVQTTPCMTPAERHRRNRQLEREGEKNANFAKQLQLPVGDAFFSSLPEVLEKIAKNQGEAALKSLGRDLLNRLGVCGLGELSSLMVNTVFAYINEQEYSDELSKCAMKNLDNDKVSKVWSEIQRFGKNTEILEKYRKFVGDTIPPWKANGYTPPDYFKDLNTDDPIIEKYTLGLKTSQEDTDIDFRFSAFKDSIALSVNGEDLLNILVNTFPDEMGWLSFFTDLTKGILKKCTVEKPNAALFAGGNWCDKRVSLPALPSIPSSPAAFSFKPSIIVNILADEIKNIIISLAVKTIIGTMRQMFAIISAGISGDGDFFKGNQHIPDLFQSDDDMQNAILENCEENPTNHRTINDTVRTILEEQHPELAAVNTLSNEDIDKFLKDSSVSLGYYEKIKLYKGTSSEVTYEKAIGLVENTNLKNYLKNYSDVEDLFLEIGRLLNVDKMEKDYFNSLYESQNATSFCAPEENILDNAYYRNKPGISQEQIDEMKNTLKDIQKDKICLAAEVVGNPAGSILGRLFSILKDKNGPVYGRVADQISQFFEPVLENQVDTISTVYREDIFGNAGFLDLVLNINGEGSNKNKLFSFFNKSSDEEESGTALNQQKTNIESETQKYNPKLNSDYNLKLNSPKAVKYLQDKSDIIINLDGKKILEYPYISTNTYEYGASMMETSLESTQKTLDNSDNKKVIKNFLTKVLSTHISSYNEDIKTIITDDARTYSYEKWENIYNSLQGSETALSSLLDKDGTLSKAKNLYKSIENVDKTSSYVLVNPYTSKESLVISYISFTTLRNMIIAEIMLKNLPIFESFSVELFPEFKLLGEYIFEKFYDTISEFTTGPERLKILEKMTQISLTAIDEGIVEPPTENIRGNIENINAAIRDWINNNRKDRPSARKKIEEDMLEVVKYFVLSDAKQYMSSLQVKFAAIEYRNLPFVNQNNSIYNYIFNSSSVLGDIKDVFGDVSSVGEISTGLKLERYINLKLPVDKKYPQGVQNLSSFKKYLNDNPLIGKISDFWESWSFGIRISSIYDFSKSGVSDSSIDYTTRNREKGFLLEADAETASAEKYFLSPLIKYELLIEDQLISKEILDKYNDVLMKQRLSREEEFLKFYYRPMNIENLISLLTIYNNEEFSDFLTLGALLPPSTVSAWKLNKKLFDNTKKYIIKVLRRE
jgi:hypothetical protein